MKSDSIIAIKNTTKIIGYFVIATSLGLIANEIIHFFRLPSMTDPISELVDFYKYKQNTIAQGLLWILLFIFGLGLIKSNFLGWLIPQIFLFIGLVYFIPFYIFEGILKNNFILDLIGFIYLLGTIGIVIFLNRNKLMAFFMVNRSKRLIIYLSIVFIGIMYYLIDSYSYIIVK